MSEQKIFIAGGLSPLARGTRITMSIRYSTRRFIPAGAGNTSKKQLGLTRRTVYPRWRGEHLEAFDTSDSVYGLSPLARGTRPAPVKIGCGNRLIPAGAGNTSAPGRCIFWDSAYPRWRGEHTPATSMIADAGGLSPLARGTHRYRDHRAV